ncbi:hypothetical protein B0T10DRAFT_317712 [Thelonectria olida]|uniref:Secreted protein n=1 Tax=Thelonectria olida TaxID=1576542 RepID=A0A9P8W8R6_9HYPO|nr:hypothetical protein B0T10DRAFT_317712 [Thelonectria olida]
MRIVHKSLAFLALGLPLSALIGHPSLSLSVVLCYAPTYSHLHRRHAHYAHSQLVGCRVTVIISILTFSLRMYQHVRHDRQVTPAPPSCVTDNVTILVGNTSAKPLGRLHVSRMWKNKQRPEHSLARGIGTASKRNTQSVPLPSSHPCLPLDAMHVGGVRIYHPKSV